MIDKILNTIKTYNMISKGDKIVIGVSGGPDSICLLHCLYILKERLQIDIVAAHLNHCLRGKDADKDERYVKEFCEGYGIDFYSKKVEVSNLAREKGISFEMAGREARYNFFNELKEKLNADKIATAHNANDNSETILMRILRGTGLEGLTGIKPIRDEIFIRPIINSTRYEIEEYCKLNNIKARQDKTNFETIYSRNKIRLELIPYIEENFNKDIINTLNRLSEILSLDNDYLNKEAIIKFNENCSFDKNEIKIRKQVFNEHIAILSRVIRLAIEKVKGNLNNLDKKHIYEIIELQRGETGKNITLPEGIVSYNNYGDIYIYENSNKANEKLKLNCNIKINKELYINDLGINIKLEVLNKDKVNYLDKCDFIKYFDYDKVIGDIFIRYRKPGDKFTPLGMKGSKKLKDFFIDLKIPKNERDTIPLICFGNYIAWIVGFRISDKFKVDKNTKKILKIKIEREE